MRAKKFIIPAIALGVLTIGVLGWSSMAGAATKTNRETIVQRIAEKFNLKEKDVQAVFDEVRQERQQEMQTRINKRLEQAVKDGVITEAQRTKLVERMTQMQKGMLTDRQKEREDMQQWLKDNGINQEKLRQYMGGPGGFGHRRGMHHMGDWR